MSVAPERPKSAFECVMADGSVFRMPGPIWDEAYQIKYGAENQEQIKTLFRGAVSKHWASRTVPTKFGFDEAWEAPFADQAALGEAVMYVYIRAALMGLALSQLTGGKSKVISFGGGGQVTEYGEKARRLDKGGRVTGASTRVFAREIATRKAKVVPLSESRSIRRKKRHTRGPGKRRDRSEAEAA